MSNVKKFFGSKREFNQTALFSVSGLSMSLTLVFACGLQMAGQWL
jgi:hypothetical protein